MELAWFLICMLSCLIAFSINLKFRIMLGYQSTLVSIEMDEGIGTYIFVGTYNL